MPVLELCGHFGSATQANAILPPKWLFALFFSVVTLIDCSIWLIFFLLSATIGRQCHVSVPNNEKNPLQPRSVCRWDLCECPEFDCQHNYQHTYCICLFLDLTLCPFPTSSGTSLRVEIQNSKWKLSGHVMGETLISDRRLQNTSCVGGRSVWCRQHGRTWIQNYRFCALKCTRRFDFLVLSDDAIRDFTLDAYTTTTSITDLTPDVDYSVSILSYYGSEESIPIFGQVTSK